MLGYVDIREAFGSAGALTAYRGIIYKVFFNIPFASALFMTAQGNDLSSVCWLATIAAYPLLSGKTSIQAGMKANFSYRGVIPFALINYFFAWQLAPLFSQSKLEHLKESVKEECIEKLGYY